MQPFLADSNRVMLVIFVLFFLMNSHQRVQKAHMKFQRVGLPSKNTKYTYLE